MTVRQNKYFDCLIFFFKLDDSEQFVLMIHPPPLFPAILKYSVNTKLISDGCKNAMRNPSQTKYHNREQDTIAKPQTRTTVLSKGPGP